MDLTPELHGLCFDRARLLRKLAPVLRRIGPGNPNRSRLNHDRTIQRKRLRKALDQNAEAIAAYIMQYYQETKIRELTDVLSDEGVTSLELTTLEAPPSQSTVRPHTP